MHCPRSVLSSGSGFFALLLVGSVGCAGGAQLHANASTNEGADARGVAIAGKADDTPPGPDRKHPWIQPPSPIAGKWKTSAYPPDMVVEITVSGKHASGRVVSVGEGAKRHYANGEEVLALEVDDFGQWVGQLRKKTLAGVDKKEPIRMVGGEGVLDGIMTTDEAFKHMTRVE